MLTALFPDFTCLNLTAPDTYKLLPGELVYSTLPRHVSSVGAAVWKEP